MNYSQSKQELINYLRKYCLLEGEFQLASGKKSNKYIDCKNLLTNGKALKIVSICMHYCLNYFETFSSVGGSGYGALPLSVSLANLYNENLNIFIVRETMKSHGTKKIVEGNIKSGEKVLLLDDVLTTGKTLLKSYRCIREIGCIPVGSLVIVNRCENMELLSKELAIPIKAIININEI